MSLLESFKNMIADAASWAAGRWTPDIRYLELDRVDQATQDRAREVFEQLSEEQKGAVYEAVWDLGKRKDCTICGDNWGRDHAFDDIRRLAQAMHRVGVLGREQGAYAVPLLPRHVGEGSGIFPQYFSLTAKAEREPITGRIGYVNGMGVPSLEHAGSDADETSDKFCDGNNLHVVYNSTHANRMFTDSKGFVTDVFRMEAINGGKYTKTSLLLAQQWIDYLQENPGKKFLQIATSEGTVHTNAALRLIHAAKPDLLARIRVISLVPAYFIDPNAYGHGLQVHSFVKREDPMVVPWGIGADRIGHDPRITVVPHETQGITAHCHVTREFVERVKPMVFKFLADGDIY